MRYNISRAWLGSLLLFLCSGHQAGAALAGWSNSVSMTVRGDYFTTQTNLVTRVVVDTASLISGGLLQSDGDDLRFTRVNGMGVEVLQDYYIVSGLNTAQTEILVKLDTMPPAPGLAKLYMYFHNNAATAGQDITKFIAVSSNFNADTLGADPAGWTVNESANAAVSVVNTQYNSASQSVSLNDTSALEWCRFYKGTGTLTKFYISGYFRFAHTNQAHNIIKCWSNSGTMLLLNADETGKWGYHDGTNYVTFASGAAYSANTWYKVELEGDFATDQYNVWINGLLAEKDIRIPTDNVNLKTLEIEPTGTSGIDQVWVDDLYVAERRPTTYWDACASDWLYTTYTYRQPLYVDTAAMANTPNAIAKFFVGTQYLIADGKMQSDCDDVRFTYYNPATQVETPLNTYYLPTNTKNLPYTTVYVKLDEMLKGSLATDGRKDQGTYQYSDAMVYFNNRTYFAYMGITFSGSHTEQHTINVTYYDHATRQWATPVPLATLSDDDYEESSDHRQPTLCIDNKGYLHCAYGSHGGPTKYKKSSSPESIGSWTTMSDIGSVTTYPRMFCDYGGKMWVFYRTGSNSEKYVYRTSTDYGANWTGETTLIDGSATSRNAYVGGVVFGRENPTQSIHLVWSWNRTDIIGGQSVYSREHVMYMKSTDGGSTWRKSDGTQYTLPATPSTAQIVYNNTDDEESCDVTLDATGKPLALSSGRVNHDLHFTRFNGSSWSTAQVNAVSSDTFGRIYVDPLDSRLEIFTRRANSSLGGGQDCIGRYISTDTGATWSKSDWVTWREDSAASYPMVCRDGGPLRAFYIRHRDYTTSAPATLAGFPRTYQNAAGTVFMYYGNVSATNAESNVSLFDTFDTQTGDPVNFTLEQPTNTDVVVDAGQFVGGSGKSCKLFDNSTTGYPAMYKNFTYNSYVGHVDLYCRFAETNKHHLPVYMRDNTGAYQDLVLASAYGDFRYESAGSAYEFPVDTAYSANTWYRVQVYWDCPRDKFWVYINGENVTNDGLAIPGNVTYFNQWRALGGDWSSTATTWLDSVLVDFNLGWPEISVIRDFEERNPF